MKLQLQGAVTDNNQVVTAKFELNFDENNIKNAQKIINAIIEAGSACYSMEPIVLKGKLTEEQIKEITQR